MTIQASSAAYEGSKFTVQGPKMDALTSTLNSQPETLASPARRGGRDTPELREAFTDFVGQTFYGELMKQMRATLHKPAFFHGGMGEDIFQQQLDHIMVERMSDTSARTLSDPMYELLMARRS
jgi:hypothetical protein